MSNTMKNLLVFLILLLPLATTQAQNTSLSIGDTAPEIQAQTLDGKPFQLSSLKGKIVLLDFWASWCAPCIEEQPELVKLYQTRYQDAIERGNFQIVGFSLDNKKENWQKVVDRFQIPWPQVSDLKFWKSPIVKNYGISELPYNLILDKEGNIVAVNIHGDELKNYLDGLFLKQVKFVSPTD